MSSRPLYQDSDTPHHHNDLTMVKRLRSELEKRAKTVWVDVEDIAVGADWQERITRGIEACKAFVFVLSTSEHNYSDVI